MDPTQDPHFIPPDSNPDMKPPANSSMIPNNPTIQPYVLADYNEAIDAPLPHPSSWNSRHHSTTSSTMDLPILRSPSSQSLDGRIQHKKIPRLPTELQPFSSDSSTSDEDDDDNLTQKDNRQLLIDKLDSLLLKNDLMDKRKPLPAHSHATDTPKIHSYQIADLEEVPHGIVRQAKTLDQYQFPTHRLSPVLKDASKFPLVIVACGSFSPVTYLHLRMFEMAMDSIREDTKFEVIGGYYSPVSDNYKKQGLAPHHHRVRMCELACERTSSWLMVDAWESLQKRYTRTLLVLDHFNEEINIKRGGIRDSAGRKRGVKIMLLAGGDLIESMGEPNVWAETDLHHILGKYGCLIVERTGSDVRSFLLSHDIMYEHRKNILVIKQLIYNDISSTKVRLFIRRNMSVQYLLPNSVIRYIQEHGLYLYDKEPVKQVMSEKAD